MESAGGRGGKRVATKTNISLKKGDEILVISGKDKGQRGKIQKVMPEINSVIVEGLNLAKKHAKPTKTSPQGGVIDKALPIKAAKVMLVCAGCNQPTRFRKNKAVDGTSVRICHLCGRTLD
ncbi:MAG: 50S ribosomal protein L24 [Firmicutes bacterium]|nr:50S ribosomal protein L24 [Bacillota bacterium]